MMLVFTIVFSVFVKVPVHGVPYPLFAFTGLVCWMFFANSLSYGTVSVVSHMNLVAKAGFPREVIPLSKLVTVAVDFVAGLAVLVGLLLAYGVPLTSALLAVPAIAVIQVMFTVGLILMGSAFYVLQRDLGNVLPLALQVWMFLSPVVYPVDIIPAQIRTLYMLNPMAVLIEAYRSVILAGTAPTLGSLSAVLLISAGVLGLGYAYFKAVELRFADVM
jgi:lipopolysaccharide transport system permease protein